MSQLNVLSDYEFELLVADLLGARDKRRYETFPRGADGGIDLRTRLGRSWHVVQCKHYPESSVSRVVTAARKELSHLTELKPARYTFVTSRRLSLNAKEKIVQAASPFLRAPSDVLGAQDVLQLLRTFPQVERQHVKLWLGSGPQLERLLQSESYERTAGLIEVLLETLPRYVQTDAFRDAKRLLDEHNVVIIAGPPGVGKTTVARLLMLDYAQRGFNPYVLQADPAEGFRLLKEDEPQVMFFDDFLGRTSLFDSVRDDTRDLSNLIQRVRGRRQTRLILSTREYIYQQARQEREELQWQKLEAEKFQLSLESYSRTERALIFYNHLRASPQISRAAKRQLLKNRAFLRIVDHPSYNPRLIEWMTGLSGQALAAAQLSNYPRYCVSVLDRPEELWAFAFDQGISYEAQLMLYALAGLPSLCLLKDLERSATEIWRAADLKAGTRRVTNALRELDDSFIHSQKMLGGPLEDELVVQVLNPSLVDFLQRRLVEDEEATEVLLAGAPFFDQVQWVTDRLLDCHSLEAFSDLVTQAVDRTSGSPAPADWHSVSFDAHPLGVAADRLLSVVGWVQSNPELRSGMIPVCDKLLRTVMGAEGEGFAWRLSELEES